MILSSTTESNSLGSKVSSQVKLEQVTFAFVVGESWYGINIVIIKLIDNTKQLT